MSLNGIHLWRSLTFPLVATLLAVSMDCASAEPGHLKMEPVNP